MSPPGRSGSSAAASSTATRELIFRRRPPSSSAATSLIDMRKDQVYTTFFVKFLLTKLGEVGLPNSRLSVLGAQAEQDLEMSGNRYSRR